MVDFGSSISNPSCRAITQHMAVERGAGAEAAAEALDLRSGSFWVRVADQVGSCNIKSHKDIIQHPIPAKKNKQQASNKNSTVDVGWEKIVWNDTHRGFDMLSCGFHM